MGNAHSSSSNEPDSTATQRQPAVARQSAGVPAQAAQPMPLAFYRVAEGHYVDINRYETMRSAEGTNLPERSQAMILFPAHNGRSLMSGREKASYEYQEFAENSHREGLNPSVRNSHDSTPPSALVYVERTRELLSPYNARRQLGADNLLEQVPEKHVFLSDFDRTGRQTGILSNAATYRARDAGELRIRIANDVNFPSQEAGLPRAGATDGTAPQSAAAHQPAGVPTQAARSQHITRNPYLRQDQDFKASPPTYSTGTQRQPEVSRQPAGVPAQAAQPMPLAFYRVGDGHYVDGGIYEAIRAAGGVDLPDRSQATILFPANNGRSLMSGRQMAFIARDAFADIRQQEGLPESVARLHDSAPPRALVYLERYGELLSPDNARRELGTENLLEQVPEQHVFLSDFQPTGRQTGNLSNATAYRERNPEELRERLENDVAGANREQGSPRAGAATTPEARGTGRQSGFSSGSSSELDFSEVDALIYGNRSGASKALRHVTYDAGRVDVTSRAASRSDSQYFTPAGSPGSRAGSDLSGNGSMGLEREMGRLSLGQSFVTTPEARGTGRQSGFSTSSSWEYNHPKMEALKAKFEEEKERPTQTLNEYMSSGPKEGTYGNWSNERNRLGIKWVPFPNHEYEFEHVVGYAVAHPKAIRNGDFGTFLKKDMPAYYEVRALHQEHAGTGYDREHLANHGWKNDSDYRSDQAATLKDDVAYRENTSVSNAIQLNQLGYGHILRAKGLQGPFPGGSTPALRTATNSFNHMVKQDPGIAEVIEENGQPARVKVLRAGRHGQAEAVLSREAALSGTMPTEAREEQVASQFLTQAEFDEKKAIKRALEASKDLNLEQKENARQDRSRERDRYFGW